MPHGTPDWGLVGPKTTTFGLDDLGEHAVRLGSPHLWDRRGDVVYWSVFAGGLEAMGPYLIGASCSVHLATGHSRQGAYSVGLASDGLAECTEGLSIQLPFPTASRAGFEYSFCYRDIADQFYHQMTWNDRTNLYVAFVRWSPAGGNLDCWVEPGAWETFAAGITHYTGFQPNCTWKVVVDLAKNRYVRTILNESEYDMGNREPQWNLMPGNPRLRWDILVNRALGSDHTLYVDSVIVTQNEP